MPRPNARITRVFNSWRVRLSGHRPKYFAFSAYGGQRGALLAARAWRDERWNGKHPGVKLTPQQRQEIATSTEYYKNVAERYGISPNYVHVLRRRILERALRRREQAREK